jgi:hypothetical protein
LAQQILSGGFKSLTTEGLKGTLADRAPTSDDKELRIRLEGRIAKDPWGNPYDYRILTSDAGGHEVVVISHGPNGRLETDVSDAQTRGDDIRRIVRQ